MYSSENACGFCGCQPPAHLPIFRVDPLTKIMAEHHHWITKTEAEEKKMQMKEGKMKVTYKNHTGTLQKLELQPQIGGYHPHYSLTIGLEDGGKVSYEGVLLGDISFFGGTIRLGN